MSVSKVAADVGMHRSTLYRILRKTRHLRSRTGKIDIAALRKFKTRPNKLGRPYGRRVILRNKQETKAEWEGRIWLERLTSEKRRHALRRWAEDCGFRGETEKVKRMANDLVQAAGKGAEMRKKWRDEDLPDPAPKSYRDLKTIIRLERRIGEPLVTVSKTGAL